MQVPLYSTTAHPDGSHGVRAAGGYEWWYFDAEDAAQDVQVVGIVLDGFVFHPAYLRRHAAYMRRPTRHAPARASDFPCAYMVVYERGKLVAQFMTQYPAGALVASSSEPLVSLGPNSITPAEGEAGGLDVSLSGTPWVLTGRGPQTPRDRMLSCQLKFRPITRHAPAERVFLSQAMTGAEHHWVVATPHSRFEGTVALTGPAARNWKLSGLAYHDHNYGTGPLGPGLQRWIWGRALFADACCTFHHAVPENESLPPETHLLRIGGGGVDELPATAWGDWSRRTALGLAYPPTLLLGDVMKLTNPRVIDPTPFYLRLIYDAECEGRRGTAFCEVAYPHRLRWPVLGRMIEMSIDNRKT